MVVDNYGCAVMGELLRAYEGVKATSYDYVPKPRGKLKLEVKVLGLSPGYEAIVRPSQQSRCWVCKGEFGVR